MLINCLMLINLNFCTVLRNLWLAFFEVNTVSAVLNSLYMNVILSETGLCVPLFVPHLMSHSPPWSVLPSEWPHLHHWKLAERETKRQRGADMFIITADTWQNRDSGQTVIRSSQIRCSRLSSRIKEEPRWIHHLHVSLSVLQTCADYQCLYTSTPILTLYLTCIILHSFALSTLMPQVFSHLVLQWSVLLERFATFLSPLWTPSSISSSSCSRFLFIPAMPLHPVMFCFQATDRTVSPPLLLSSLPYALCSTTAFTARAVSLALPIEVSALPGCQIWKEFWHDCVPLHTLWHMQMARNGPGRAKLEEHEQGIPGREGLHMEKKLNVPLISRK